MDLYLALEGQRRARGGATDAALQQGSDQLDLLDELRRVSYLNCPPEHRLSWLKSKSPQSTISDTIVPEQLVDFVWLSALAATSRDGT